MAAMFVAAMEDVLDLYAEPYDADRPVVCFDETSTQLLADVREPLPVQPGRPRCQDYECRRAGTRNLFLFCEPRAGWRVRFLTNQTITERRTMVDFARQMQWLVDVAYPTPRDPRGPRQSEHPLHGLPVRDLSRPRSPPHRETPGVSPPPKHASWLDILCAKPSFDQDFHGH